jgi:hypothetical protein
MNCFCLGEIFIIHIQKFVVQKTLIIYISSYESFGEALDLGIATGYRLEDRRVGVRVPVGPRIFSTSSRPALGYPASYPMGTEGSFPRGKPAAA